MNYGHKNNIELFLKYGFTLKNQPKLNAALIIVGLDPDQQHFDFKQKYIHNQFHFQEFTITEDLEAENMSNLISLTRLIVYSGQQQYLSYL